MSFDELKPVSVNPKDVIVNLAKSAEWQVEDRGDAVQLTLSTGTLRRQKVLVRFNESDADGNQIVSFTSTCGPLSPENATTLLKYNLQMVHGAFAIESTDSGEMIVMRANQLASTLDAMEATRVITAVAWQADRVEEKLMGTDDH